MLAVQSAVLWLQRVRFASCLWSGSSNKSTLVKLMWFRCWFFVDCTISSTFCFMFPFSALWESKYNHYCKRLTILVSLLAANLEISDIVSSNHGLQFLESSYYCIWAKGSMKPFLPPEEAVCNKLPLVMSLSGFIALWVIQVSGNAIWISVGFYFECWW